MDRTVDLQRFMGDWYVIGFIPITLPFLSEDGAHNGVESYRLTDEGVIETTYTFRDGGFDGPEKRFTPKGWVHDHETNAEWRMQFLWPFKSAYAIVYLDENYQKTIIGVLRPEQPLDHVTKPTDDRCRVPANVELRSKPRLRRREGEARAPTVAGRMRRRQRRGLISWRGGDTRAIREAERHRGPGKDTNQIHSVNPCPVLKLN